MIDRCGRGLLDILDLALEGVLLHTQIGGLPIEELLRNAIVELIHVHGPDAGLDLVGATLELLDRLPAGRLLTAVGTEHSFAKPFEDRGRDDQLAQQVGELAREDFLPRMRLRAFPAVAGAVVVHVFTLLELAHQQATAMPTVDQPGVGEVALDLARAILGASTQQLINAVPTLASHQWLVDARVCSAVPVEIAGVQALSTVAGEAA